MAYPLSFSRESLICKENFQFLFVLAVVAIKEPQDIRPVLKLGMSGCTWLHPLGMINFGALMDV